MGDVIFYDNDDTARPVRPVAKVKQTFLSSLVIKSGLAKTVAQAEQVMLIIAIVGLLASVGVVALGYYPNGSGTNSAQLSAATARIEVQQLQAEQADQAAEASSTGQ